MLSSIQESFEKQTREQGRPIGSTENGNYLSSLAWKDTVEGEIFWRILYYSYAMYHVYDYGTIISIYIRFNTLSNNNNNNNNNNNIAIYYIYRDYFDKVSGTLTSEGFEKLIKQIGK